MTRIDDSYVIEWLEEGTWQILQSVSFSAKKNYVAAIIGADASDLLERGWVELTPQQLDELVRQRLVERSEHRGMILLRRSDESDQLPYVLHSNREVELIVRGTKPFAFFSAWLPDGEQHLEAVHAAFGNCPIADRLSIRWCCWPDEKPDHRSLTLYVARESEEWRIDAHILLHACMPRTGWNDGFELMEGFLLGYEAWQNEVHLQSRAARQK